MIERADQLVLEYVSKVADLAHGVLRTEQRLDFVQRLRARIEEERRGTDDLATVRKVIAVFGDPADLVQREVRRLAAAAQEAGRHAATARPCEPPARLASVPSGVVWPSSGRTSRTFPAGDGPAFTPSEGLPGGAAPAAPGGTVRTVSDDDFGDDATEVIPVIVDDDPPTAVSPRPPHTAPPMAAPPGRLPGELPGEPSGEGERAARSRSSPGAARGSRDGSPAAPAPGALPSGPFARLRRAAMAGANTMAAHGRDARGILRDEPREVVAMALLSLAGLLIPLPLPSIAIFPVPVLVWALGALAVLTCEGWVFKDRLIALTAPMAAYLIGGAVLGALKASEAPGTGVGAFLASFWHVSGFMFMLGTGAGVFWLACRLLNPPAPPPRRRTAGTPR